MVLALKECTEKSSSSKVYMPNFGLSPRLGMRYNFWWQVPRRGGREAEGGGLLILPDLFARTHFRLFCLRYEPLSCVESPHLQFIVQQVFSNNSRLHPYS